MAGQVAGKVALVTGGASGIGQAIAELLAEEGAIVVATDIDDLKGPDVVAGIKKAGGEAVFLHQDVTSEPRWAEVVGEIERRFGRLDVLVSNAGIGIGAASIVDMSLADWRRQTAINLDGVFLSVKYSLPLMRKTAGGSIIMMSSLAGLRGSATLAGYSATKGAVRLFAKSIAMECASVGDGIRVNSVHPGIIETPIWHKIPAGGVTSGQNAPIDFETMAKLGCVVQRTNLPQGTDAGTFVQPTIIEIKKLSAFFADRLTGAYCCVAGPKYAPAHTKERPGTILPVIIKEPLEFSAPPSTTFSSAVHSPDTELSQARPNLTLAVPSSKSYVATTCALTGAAIHRARNMVRDTSG